MGSYYLQTFGLTDPGRIRARNEDVWGAVAKYNLAVVADGMGGHQAGDVAALLALETLIDYVWEHFPKDQSDQIEELLGEAVCRVNDAVYHKAQTDPRCAGMGTTLCTIYLGKEKIWYAHVGDSRIYRFHQQKLHQLTEDHSLLNEMINSGQLDSDEADQFVFKHVITRAIGTSLATVPDVAAVPIELGDIYLICSDGLTDLVNNGTIERLLKGAASLEDGAEGLMRCALEAGGTDNVTVLLAQIAYDKDLS